MSASVLPSEPRGGFLAKRIKPATVTVPALLWAEAIESLGGIGLCNPGDQLTESVIADAADLSRRMDEAAE